MLDIDLAAYHDKLRITTRDGKRYIYDPIRKMDYVLQPEEMVRQSWIQYLNEYCGLSFAVLAVEKQLTLGEIKRRFDLVYYKQGTPHTLFEFKSYKIKITEQTALQAAHYNTKLKVPYIILSNGPTSYAYYVDHANGTVEQLSELPF